MTNTPILSVVIPDRLDYKEVIENYTSYLSASLPEIRFLFDGVVVSTLTFGDGTCSEIKPSASNKNRPPEAPNAVVDWLLNGSRPSQDPQIPEHQTSAPSHQSEVEASVTLPVTAKPSDTNMSKYGFISRKAIMAAFKPVAKNVYSNIARVAFDKPFPSVCSTIGCTLCASWAIQTSVTACHPVYGCKPCSNGFHIHMTTKSLEVLKRQHCHKNSTPIALSRQPSGLEYLPSLIDSAYPEIIGHIAPDARAVLEAVTKLQSMSSSSSDEADANLTPTNTRKKNLKSKDLRKCVNPSPRNSIQKRYGEAVPSYAIWDNPGDAFAAHLLAGDTIQPKRSAESVTTKSGRKKRK